jgi:hypothetical protein
MGGVPRRRVYALEQDPRSGHLLRHDVVGALNMAALGRGLCTAEGRPPQLYKRRPTAAPPVQAPPPAAAVATAQEAASGGGVAIPAPLAPAPAAGKGKPKKVKSPNCGKRRSGRSS